MPKLVSDKQRLANRRNAQKSTGPKTARGKARSSRNALKHGLLAKDVVVDTPHGHERQADFDALLADLVAELKPQSIIEQTLVERIATCYWRLRRAQRFEVGAIRGARPPDMWGAQNDALWSQYAEIRVRKCGDCSHRAGFSLRTYASYSYTSMTIGVRKNTLFQRPGWL